MLCYYYKHMPMIPSCEVCKFRATYYDSIVEFYHYYNYEFLVALGLKALLPRKSWSKTYWVLLSYRIDFLSNTKQPWFVYHSLTRYIIILCLHRNQIFPGHLGT